jgi:1-acyl-sn-glycerol-3-phosphate acyltransferase
VIGSTATPAATPARSHAAGLSRWLDRPHALGVVAVLLITFASCVLAVIGLVTAFRARRIYAAFVRLTSLAVLRLYGIRLTIVQREPFPRTQTVYVSNHSSTLDIFILVALGLPNCRFFLSGFLRTYIPLGLMAWMMGTFFTVPQDRPEERRRIFAAAARTLRRTGESVYLSPEGARIVTGQIGHFNKGAFHLATDLRAPIVPLYLSIPREIDPGRGVNARPGRVTVEVLPTIDTRDWVLEDLEQNVARVRDVFVRRHAARDRAATAAEVEAARA